MKREVVHHTSALHQCFPELGELLLPAGARQVAQLVQPRLFSRLRINSVNHRRQITVSEKYLIGGADHFEIQISQYLISHISARNVKNGFYGLIPVKIHQRMRSLCPGSAECGNASVQERTFHRLQPNQGQPFLQQLQRAFVCLQKSV